MTGIFKANNPFNPFLLFIYGLILKSWWILHPPIFKILPDEGLFFKLIAQSLTAITVNNFFYVALAYALLFVQAMMFNRLLNNLRMWPKPNYLPAMSYLLLSSLLPEWNTFSSGLLVNSLLIWGFAKIFKLYNTPAPKTFVFDLGLIIGLISLLNFPAIVLVIFILIALSIVRSFNLKEGIIALVGVATPYYFLAAVLYLKNSISNFKFPYLFRAFPFYQTDVYHMAAFGIILLLFIIGLFFVQTGINKYVVQVRKNWAIIFLFTVFAIIVSLAGNKPLFQYFLMLLLPVSPYVAASFFHLRRIIAEILHLSLVVLVIYCSYFLK
ncbi:hypothetical protein BH09BAC2_BH09BAC2_21410 [soil metagenome]